MKIGIIGAGNIGATLAKKIAAAGHSVKLANSRGAQSLKEAVEGTSVNAVDKNEAVRDVDVIILSLPFAKNPELKTLLTDVPASTIIVDTSNYYPARDGGIADVDAGQLETIWSSEQIGKPLIKTWNALLAATLVEGGTKRGTPGRIAIPIAGDDAAAKSLISDLVSTTGFDTVDAGGLSDSWRLQPGTPAYCTELTAADLQRALASAVKDRASANRDAIMQAIMDGKVPFERSAMVANNRAMSV